MGRNTLHKRKETFAACICQGIQQSNTQSELLSTTLSRYANTGCWFTAIVSERWQPNKNDRKLENSVGIDRAPPMYVRIYTE